MSFAKIDAKAVHAAHASALALGDAMVSFCEDEAHRALHLEAARSELRRAANALGCTVKPDTGTMVIMQQTETKISDDIQAQMTSVMCRAAEADQLRCDLDAADDANLTLTARVRILEDAEAQNLAEISRLRATLDDRAKVPSGEWRSLEDKALWSQPVKAEAAREAA